MSSKLLSDTQLAIHGKVMAKNGLFFMEFWPIFDIFHWLRPYLCSKRGYLGFHKQATHRRHDDEPFFHSGVDRSWLGMAKNGPFWTKNGQTWQACQHSKVVQKGPKGIKMIKVSVLTVRDPFGPIWTLLDHFKQELNFCSKAPLPNPTFSILGKEIIFVRNGTKGSRWAQKGSQMVKYI